MLVYEMVEKDILHFICATHGSGTYTRIKILNIKDMETIKGVLMDAFLDIEVSRGIKPWGDHPLSINKAKVKLSELDDIIFDFLYENNKNYITPILNQEDNLLGLKKVKK